VRRLPPCTRIAGLVDEVRCRSDVFVGTTRPLTPGALVVARPTGATCELSCIAGDARRAAGAGARSRAEQETTSESIVAGRSKTDGRRGGGVFECSRTGAANFEKLAEGFSSFKGECAVHYSTILTHWVGSPSPLSPSPGRSSAIGWAVTR
jgi:hypothetical protein